MNKSDKYTISEHKEKLKFRILRSAMPMFKQKGIKAVRMDDIASHLSISKRTLYEIYANKEILLLECIKLDCDDFTKRLQDYTMIAENELDIVITFFRMKFAELDSLSPLFIEELKKYEEVRAFFRKRHDEQRKSSDDFIKKCIEKGFFAPNINYSTVQDICDEIMSFGIFGHLLDKYTLREIFYNFIIAILRGLCTEKGIVMLDLNLKKSPI